MQVIATIWVCPVCQSYYGSSAAPDLANTPQPSLHGKDGDVMRSICPNTSCTLKGVHRVAHAVRITVQNGEAS